MNLLTAMVCAPLIGFATDDQTLHAITMDAVCTAWVNDQTATSACGTSDLKVLTSGDLLVEWPPRVRSLPPGWERCRECHELTGRRRPRSSWKAA